MKLYKNKEWLEQKYLKEKLSTAEIAKECGVTDTNISYWLIKYGILRRSQSEALKGKFCGEKNGNYKGGRKKHKGYILIFKPEHPFCDKGGYVPEHRLVMEEHLGRYLTKDEVAHHINEIRNDNRIENLKLFPTKGEHHSFHNKREKNPSWIDGRSFESYEREFNNKFRRAIRKRDNHICLKCNIHQEKLSRTLNVHHINYDKKLTIPQNCCSLCNKCNIEVNKNRKHWTKFFQSLLFEKYGYQYNENGEIILDIKNDA